MTATVLNRVRAGFYLDSVALMRLSQEIGALEGVEAASLMIGTPSNRALLADAGLLTDGAVRAGPNDLILAVRGDGAAAAAAALDAAERLLDRRDRPGAPGAAWHPRSLDTAIAMLPDANLALISVPGAFAAREARMALRSGLNVMLFSDNLPVAEERELKEEAMARGLLLMGPDCGTALIAGTPLAFANAVPRGGIGAVAASGTGLQEVSTLIARAGGGISHGIGVGARDLSEDVGGIMTMMALDVLDRDAGTDRIVLISKPPAPPVAQRVFDRVAGIDKPVVVCFLGMAAAELPGNAVFAPTLRAAAEAALGGASIGAGFDAALAALSATRFGDGERIVGLFSGGTLCAEAQVVLRAAGRVVVSNAPVPGVARDDGSGAGDVLLDLGADEYTLGRPHPMIEPSVREAPLVRALSDPTVAAVLTDVVLGHGTHADPAGRLAAAMTRAPPSRPPVVASVCGTEHDPQGYSAQVAALREAGVIVAPSNAHAAEVADLIARR